MPEGDAPAREIVRTELDEDLVADEDLDVILADLPADGGQHGLLGIGGAVNGALEHGVGSRRRRRPPR